MCFWYLLADMGKKYNGGEYIRNYLKFESLEARLALNLIWVNQIFKLEVG